MCGRITHVYLCEFTPISTEFTLFSSIDDRLHSSLRLTCVRTPNVFQQYSNAQHTDIMKIGLNISKKARLRISTSYLL